MLNKPAEFSLYFFCWSKKKTGPQTCKFHIYLKGPQQSYFQNQFISFISTYQKKNI